MIAYALLSRLCSGNAWPNYNRVLAAKADEQPVPKPHHFKDNWLRFVIHQLLLGCKTPDQLGKNQLNIITFNYDLSAETSIQAALSETSFLQSDRISAFMDAPRFLHMYGALRPVNIGQVHFGALRTAIHTDEAVRIITYANIALNACEEAAQDIRVIDPHNKDNDTVSKQAQALMQEAERIYVLGFGFDLNNTRRLGFPLGNPPGFKKIYFTNLDNAMAVNKRVVAATGIGEFEMPEKWISARFNLAAEKSTRDCYQSLALDFGAFEDCSIPK